MTKAEHIQAAESLAQQTVRDLDLITFVRSWNKVVSAYHSLIPDYDRLWCAVDYDEELSRRAVIAQMAAEELGVRQQYEHCVQRLVEPVIRETFADGLLAVCQAWAIDLIREGPLRNVAPAPFRTTGEWIDWCLAELDGPILADPDGEELVSPAHEERLARVALASQEGLARKCRWLLKEETLSPKDTRH